MAVGFQVANQQTGHSTNDGGWAVFGLSGSGIENGKSCHSVSDPLAGTRLVPLHEAHQRGKPILATSRSFILVDTEMG